MEPRERIAILDGFRCLAILPVLLFHFYSRWSVPGILEYYPFGNAYASFFRPGNLGVGYFSLGMIFYCLYKKMPIKKNEYALLGMLVLNYFITGGLVASILLVIMTLLFLLFIYRPQSILFLESKVFAQIGLSSYSLYLIHEGLGVILIGKMAAWLQYPCLNWLIPVFVTGVCILFALAEYHFYEVPVIRVLRRLIGRTGPLKQDTPKT